MSRPSSSTIQRHRFGANIAEFTRMYRLEQGLTQKELGDALGFHAQYISNVEGSRHPNPLAFASVLAQHVERRRLEYLKDIMMEISYNRVNRKLEKRARK